MLFVHCCVCCVVSSMSLIIAGSLTDEKLNTDTYNCRSSAGVQFFELLFLQESGGENVTVCVLNQINRSQIKYIASLA